MQRCIIHCTWSNEGYASVCKSSQASWWCACYQFQWEREGKAKKFFFSYDFILYTFFLWLCPLASNSCSIIFQARKFYESAIRLEPGFLGAALALADLHVAEGRNKEAVLLLERYLRQWADDSLHIKLAQVFAATSLLSDALSHYQSALRYAHLILKWNYEIAALSCRKASCWILYFPTLSNTICLQSCASLFQELIVFPPHQWVNCYLEQGQLVPGSL